MYNELNKKDHQEFLSAYEGICLFVRLLKGLHKNYLANFDSFHPRCVLTQPTAD